MSKLINNLAAAAKITKQKQQRLYHTIKLQHGTVYMLGHPSPYVILSITQIRSSVYHISTQYTLFYLS
jgi:hypothetical protein